MDSDEVALGGSDGWGWNLAIVGPSREKKRRALSQFLCPQYETSILVTSFHREALILYKIFGARLVEGY